VSLAAVQENYGEQAENKLPTLKKIKTNIILGFHIKQLGSTFGPALLSNCFTVIYCAALCPESLGSQLCHNEK
jgi:hypothetical protein